MEAAQRFYENDVHGPNVSYKTSTNQPADSPARSPLELAVVKVAEEVDLALVAAEAVDEAVEDSKAVATFRAVSVGPWTRLRQ